MSAAGPGFVDLQVNGFGGTGFSDPELREADVRAAWAAVLERGTAAFLPTLVSAPAGVYRRNLSMLARVAARSEFAGRVLGFHLEGPFLAPDARVLGAHRLEHVVLPDSGLLRQMQEWAGGRVRLLTLAAEPPGAATLAQAARGLGIAVSVGHSWAMEDELRTLWRAGARALTHLGNALPQWVPRHENPIIAGLAARGYTATIIADGHHLSRSFVQTVLRARGVGRVIAVSDASPAAGLPPGRYRALGQEVVVEPSGRIVNPAEAHLAGSSATLLGCVNQLLSWRLLDPGRCWRVAFHNPLALLGIAPGEISATPRVRYDIDSHSFIPTAF